MTFLDQHNRHSGSLSTGEAVVATAVVCVVCSFTAGLLVGVLLTRCVYVCKQPKDVKCSKTSPAYEDIPSKISSIQLHHNDAYVTIV